MLTRGATLFSVTARALLLAAALCLMLSAVARADVEPNDSILQAEGPLVAGKLYNASLQTNNDNDHFYFYAPAQTQLKLTFTNVTGCQRFEITGPDGASLGLKEDASYQNVKTLTYTTPAAVTRLFVEVSAGSCFSDAGVGLGSTGTTASVATLTSTGVRFRGAPG